MTAGPGWAFLPSILTGAVLLVRTRREDQYLRSELEGFAAFSQRSRYRLFPGLW